MLDEVKGSLCTISHQFCGASISRTYFFHPFDADVFPSVVRHEAVEMIGCFYSDKKDMVRL